MSRQKSTSQKAGGGRRSANDLVQFHYRPPPVAETSSPPSPRRRNHQHKTQRNQQSHRRTAQDRASARRQAHAQMFPLHSSAPHSFALTRQVPATRCNSSTHTFQGCDEPVSWESVRWVQERVSISSSAIKTTSKETDPSNPNCPICLSDYTAARITKCGHIFCLPCLLRHLHVSTQSNPYQAVKCPCCGLGVLVDDLRPVVLQTVITPTLHQSITLTKLHRPKTCAAPSLPLPKAWRHASPRFAPITTDPDAAFARFHYLDTVQYESILRDHQRQLQCLLNNNTKDAVDDVEQMFVHMALDLVTQTWQHHQTTVTQELALQEQFATPATGMYQPPLSSGGGCLLYSDTKQDEKDEAEAVQETAPPVADQSPTNNDKASVQQHSNNPNKSRHSKNNASKYAGSMYLGNERNEDNNQYCFYQATDGQLIFLNGFNMTLLLQDFDKYCTTSSSSSSSNQDLPPHETTSTTTTTQETLPKPPLPDTIKGTILESQAIHLTPDVRKRMPFLAHLPLYIDLVLVELDLNHMLSPTTKQAFQKELQKRKKKRHKKVADEKRARHQQQVQERQAIQARKAQWEHRQIDPQDEFFHAAAVVVPDEALSLMDVGPALTAATGTANAVMANHPTTTVTTPPLNFSLACRLANNPVLNTAEAFPALGSSSDSGGANHHHSSSGRPSWRPLPPTTSRVVVNPTSTEVSTHRMANKPKKKGSKQLLFSTGGQRGMY